MKLKCLLFFLLLINLFSLEAFAQQCVNEPVLNAPDINPAPLVTADIGDATYSFNFFEVLIDYPFSLGNEVVIEIIHSDIEPANGAASVGGPCASSFNWTYNSGTNILTGRQNTDLLVATPCGEINVTFNVTPQAPNCPDNATGFTATIIPPACMTFNNTSNDVVTSLTCVNQILPVELTAFDAILVNKKDGYLTWSTATESNNEKFEVERSFDGVNFDYINSIAGAGTTNEAQLYDYTDPNLPVLSVREIYYRLKQIDFDESYTYSNIELITLTKPQVGLQVIPIDFGSIYRLKETSGEGINRIQLYTTGGAHVLTKNFDRSDIVDIEVSTLSDGIYILTVNNKHHRKLIVTNN